MKNKTVKSLSIILSVCMLGTSSASAAEFSSGPASVEEVPVQEETGEELTDQDSTEESEEDAFGTGEEKFSDTDESEMEEFSSEEEIPGVDEEVVAGPVDNTLEARMKDSAVEADIEADPNVKTTCNVYTGNSVEAQDYDMYGHRISSYLTTSPDGGLMRVQAGAISDKVLVEYYDNSYNIQRTVTVPLALPLFSAFYESGSNYYILTGQNNDDQDKSREVYRVTKYSKNWEVQGYCSLTSNTEGINTVHPFEDGSARMTMNGNYLYVRTCRTMYKNVVDGRNHQSNLTFSIDTSNMTLADQYGSALGTKYGYVTHSFNQFIQVDNGKLVGLDQGDSHPRALVMLKYPSDLSGGKFAPKSQKNGCEEVHFMDFPEGGGNYTGASVGGFEYSDSAYLTAGNYDSSGMYSSRNVFVASVSKSGTQPTVKYFTNYSGEDSASTPYLIKTGSNQFMLMWSNRGTVYYTVLDGNGNQVGSTYSMTGNLSDCAPSIINGKLIWYTWHDNVNVFYEINLSSLSSNRAVKIVNGHQPVYGKATDGRVTRKCKNCNQDLGSAMVPTGIGRVYFKNANSKRVLESGQKFSNGQSYEIEWETQHKNWTSDLDALDDCVVSSSDESILSVSQTDESHAVITTKKSGKVTLMIAAKYNSEAVINIELYVNMQALDNNEFKITFSPYSAAYNGREQKPQTILQTLSGGKWQDLEEGKDYTVNYDSDFINAGQHTATVTGIGSYTGTLKSNFTINKKSLRAGCTVTPKEDSVIYNGKKQKPGFIVKDGDRTLTEGKDYTVTYKNNVKVGTAKATISGINNYESYIDTSFKIALAPTEKPAEPDKPTQPDNPTKPDTSDKTDISKAYVLLSKYGYEYDGKSHKPTVSGVYINNKLVDSKNYTVTYSKDLVNAGTPEVTITGKGSFTGTCKVTFTISPRNFSNCTVIDPEGPFYYYEGTAYTPKYVVKDGDKTLVEGKDYQVTYKYNDKPGHSWNTIQGMGNYRNDVIQRQFYIIPPLLSECTASLENDTVIYDGHPAEPNIIVKFGERTLKLNQDYTVSYVGNDSPGTAIAYIYGKGTYNGRIILNFTIKKAGAKTKNLSKAEVTISGNVIDYGKRMDMPQVTVNLDGKVLTKSVDFIVTYRGSVGAKTGTLIITGRGDYTGVIERPVNVIQKNTELKDISGYTVGIGGDNFTYTGSEIKPKVQVSSETEDLTEGTDYTVSYENNIEVGTATAIIKGTGNYTGTLTITFKIVAKSQDDANKDKIAVGKCDYIVMDNEETYDGTAHEPDVIVAWLENKLTEGQDYTLTYSNNVNAGTAKVTITGIGKYTGSVTTSFEIKPASPEITAKSKTVNMGSGKQDIMERILTDAKITCTSTSPAIVEISGNSFIPKKPGKATIIITTTGEKNYFSMEPVKLTVTVRPLNTQKLTLKSRAKGKLTVSWNIAKSVSGYEIQYSRSKNMKNAQSLTIKGKTTQVTLKKLNSKKNYCVRIRTYKTTNGKRYYSTWSSVKTVKVK